MKKIIISFISFIIFIACEKQNKNEVSEKVNTQQTTVQEIPEGQKLMEQNCFLCHNPSTNHNERVAPPMIAIKARYRKNNTTREEFIKDFIAFSEKPTKEKAKMKEALEKFNLMPNQAFSKEDLTKIAEYVYDYQIEEPIWFKEHWKEKHGSSYHNSGKKISKIETKKTLAEIGLSYALGTKKVLGKNLMGTIQKKGTIAALQFCNHKAYPLTDSMSTQFNAKIKRVSDQPRNPLNQANKEELAIIATYKKAITDQSAIKPITKENGKNIQFYYPITTNTMCLQCHGKPTEQIKPATLDLLAKLYPKDRAKGYEANQVRGIWSISFEEK